jgi:RNA polymerase sigma factor (sigma-70 family)
VNNITESLELPDFEQIVSNYFEALYRFAFSLTRAEADASDLTQQTFYIWATKRHQLRDHTKVKSWLFTTLHREFIRLRKRSIRFPHFELDDAAEELPSIPPETVSRIDALQAVELLDYIAESYRAAITLFYLEDCSYKDIAEILEIPIGTVRSRISRGLAQLQEIVVQREKNRPQLEFHPKRSAPSDATPTDTIFRVCRVIPAES